MEYRVQWAEHGVSFGVAPDEPVLEAALRANVALPHDCQFGGCGTCRIKLVEGTVAYDDELPMGLSPEEEAQGYALACQAKATSDLVISTERLLPCPAQPTRQVAMVKHVRLLSADVCHLVLAIPALENLVYRAGQYLNVHLGDGRVRSFSMASAPRDGIVDLHIRRIPGGHFTQGLLTRLKVADTLDVEFPLGTFGYHAQDYRPLVMVATGTGLAPLKSMLESLADDPDCPPVSLYWGMRDAADLYLDAQIKSWASRLCDFRYVPVLSRAHASWQGRRGYVQQAVLEDFADLSEHAIYLCGSPAMIADAKQQFFERGASIHHVYADSFTFAQDASATSAAAA